MLTKRKLCILLLIFVLYDVDCARILCVFPMPSPSHQSVFRTYTQELARLGHELVIVTPIPALPKERSPDNVTEIDVGPISNDVFSNMLSKIKSKGLFKRGFILDLEAYVDDSVVDIYAKLFLEISKHSDVAKLIKKSNQHFDLLVIETMMDTSLLLTDIFKAPVILFSSFYGYAKNYEAVGAFTHPTLHPQCMRNYFGAGTVWEKIRELYSEWKLRRFYSKVKDTGDKLLKLEYGPQTPSIDELRNNVDLLFLNVHPIYDFNRAVPPNVIYLGALHIEPAKELSQDLKTYLDNSKQGVVYVSLGTMIRSSEIEREFLDQFLEAFERLPYNVLFKFEIEILKTTPKNVKVQKWFPQRDLLIHPNIKAFITQGGIHSTDEAIEAAVPIVGIPFMVDQWYNVYRSEQLGIGVQLDTFTLTADDIVQGVKTVIEDKSYKSNILKLRSLIKHQPETSLQRAIWWTEYVLRHGGARHLRSPGANISWREYLMLDILLSLAAVFISLAFITFLIIKYVLRLMFSGKSQLKFKPKIQ